MTTSNLRVGRAHAAAAVGLLGVALFFLSGAVFGAVSLALKKSEDWRVRVGRIQALEDRLAEQRRDAVARLAAIGAGENDIDLIASPESSIEISKRSCAIMGAADCVIQSAPITAGLVRRSSTVTVTGPLPDLLSKMSEAASPPVQFSEFAIRGLSEANTVELRASLTSIGAGGEE